MAIIDEVFSDNKPASILDDVFPSGRPLKQKVWKAVEPYVGMAETAAEQGGGILDFFNPIPGAVGLGTLIGTGSLGEATKAIEEPRQKFRPYTVYQPRTESGQALSEMIGQGLDYTVARGAEAFGDIGMKAAMERGATAEDAALIGAVGKTIADLIAMGLLFKGPKAYAALKKPVVTPESTIKATQKLSPQERQLSPEDITLRHKQVLRQEAQERELAEIDKRAERLRQSAATEDVATAMGGFPEDIIQSVFGREAVETGGTVKDTLRHLDVLKQESETRRLAEEVNAREQLGQTQRLQEILSTAGGREKAIGEIYDSLVAKGFSPERRMEIMNQLFPDLTFEEAEGISKRTPVIPTPSPEEITTTRTSQTLPEAQKGWDVTIPTPEETRGYGTLVTTPLEIITPEDIAAKLRFYDTLDKSRMDVATQRHIDETTGVLREEYYRRTGKYPEGEPLPKSKVYYKGKIVTPSEAPPEGLSRGEQITVKGGGPTLLHSLGLPALKEIWEKHWKDKVSWEDFIRGVSKKGEEKLFAREGIADTTLYSGVPLHLFPDAWKNMVDWFGEKVKNTAWGKKAFGEYNSILDFFNPGMTVPLSKEWFYARQEAMGGKAAGEYSAKKFTKRYKDMPLEDRQEIWKFMNGDIPIQILREDLRPVAKQFRQLDNQIGRDLVRAGIISEDAYRRLEGRHIRYIYNQYMTGEGLEISGGGKINTKAFQDRKDLTDIERERLGLVKDPIAEIADTMIQASHAIAMTNYFSKVAGTPEWIWQPSVITFEGRKMGIGKARDIVDTVDRVQKEHPEWTNPEQLRYRDNLKRIIGQAEEVSGKPPSDYVQLNGKGYGALDGMYVNKTIANDVKPVFEFTSGSTSRILTTGRELVNTGTALWKLKSVALNIPTAMRNIISNIIQLNMSGTPLYEIPVYLTKAIRSMIAEDGRFMDALKQGVFKGNWSASELSEILDIAMKEGTLKNMLDMGRELGKYYGKIDDVFKFAKMIEGLEKGLSVPEAARLGIKWGMDYSLVHPAVKYIRTNPFGAPFVTYQYKIAPLIIESLRDRPWAAAKFMALPWILQQALTKDMTDEDAQKYIKALPDYIRNGQVLLLPGTHGMNALDVSYMVPWGNWWQVGMEISHGEFSKIGKELGVSGAILPTLIYASRTGKDLFTDEPIVSPLSRGNVKEQAWDMAKYIWTQAMPPMLAPYGAVGRIVQHERFGMTKQGLQTEWYNAYPRMAGMNIYPVNPNAQMIEKRHDINEVRKALFRRAMDRTLSPEERREIMQIYKFAIEDIKEGK
jgi:hypothetical protein